MRRRGRVGLPRPTPATTCGQARRGQPLLRLVAVCFWRIAAVGITASAFDWDGA